MIPNSATCLLRLLCDKFYGFFIVEKMERKNLETRLLYPLLALILFQIVAVHSESCCRPKRTPSSDPDVRDIASLDRFHKELMLKKILRALQLKEIPVEAVEWGLSFGEFNHSTGLRRRGAVSNEADFEIPETPTEYTVRVISNVRTGHQDINSSEESRKSKTKRRSVGCQLSHIFSVRLIPRKRHHRKEIVGAELWVPEIVWQKLRNPQLSFIFGQNSSLPHSVPFANFRQEEEYRVMNISNESLAEISQHSRHHLRHLRMVFSGNYPLGSCSSIRRNPSLNLLESTLLSLQIREAPHRSPKKRNAKSKQKNLIVDCETQWDQAFLNSTSMFLRENLLPCCRRRVHVDFEEIGWGHWVVAPLGFDTSYCLGRCSTFGGFASENTDGPALYAELMNYGQTAQTLGVHPCCSPVKFAPLTITVLIGNREEMTQTFKDIIVTQCGCM